MIKRNALWLFNNYRCKNTPLSLPQCCAVFLAALEVSRRAAVEVSCRSEQRPPELQNLTILYVISLSILNLPPSLQVLSAVPENALAQSESTLLSSRGVWEHLEVLKSTDKVARSVWEDCLLLLD
jgi:hypothetical protein